MFTYQGESAKKINAKDHFLCALFKGEKVIPESVLKFKPYRENLLKCLHTQVKVQIKKKFNAEDHFSGAFIKREK